MSIDEIREQLAYKISTDMIWDEKTNDTTPGNYGCDNVTAVLSSDDIYVDIPNLTFTFKNANYSFSARVGGSRDEDSHMYPFSTIAKGEGKFEFKDKGTVEIAEIDVYADLDLFA
jgi:hypothetical protein